VYVFHLSGVHLIPEHRRELSADLARAQAAEVDLSGHGSAYEFGERGTICPLGIPMIHHDHQAFVAQGVGDVLEEQDRCLICPLRIVQGDHQGTFCRDLPKQSGESVEL
jgi:hypothetical protein